MILMVSVYTNRGFLVTSEAMYIDEEIDVYNFDHQCLTQLNLKYIIDQYKNCKLLIRLFNDVIIRTFVYIYDYESRTVLKAFKSNRANHILTNGYFYRIDLPTTDRSHEYQVGDHVYYRHEGLICRGTVRGKMPTGYKPEPYWIEEDEEKYEAEDDPLYTDDIFFEYTEGIHHDDIIGLIE